MTLETEKILHILGPDGYLSKVLKGFEPREQQRGMMRNVIDAYNNNQIALIEAGTGTGKSMAYLIPALLWADKNKERTLISTNTITLQEQLINKDIPTLTQTLHISVRAVLVKGMGNYLCLRKLADAKEELRLLPFDEAAELEKIEAWNSSTADGSKAALPFIPSFNTWERVCAENDTCNHVECPFYQNCHFFKARRLANEAQILVANHHLLFADLFVRAETDNYKSTAILPNYTRIILDEAHHIEDVATEFFGENISRLGLLRLMGRLASEKNANAQGKLVALKNKLQENFGYNPAKEVSSLLNRLAVDLPGIRRDLQQLTVETFQKIGDFTNNAIYSPSPQDDLPQAENKLRLLPAHQSHSDWTKEVVPAANKLIGSLRRYTQSLDSLESDLKPLSHERFQEQTKGIRLDIAALSARLENAGILLERFIMSPPPPSKVRWIESQKLRMTTNISLQDAELDVSRPLVNFLFDKFHTIVLCSATLTTNKQFQFIRARLGLTDDLLPGRPITENIYGSPFNYPQQALLAIPKDIPSPSHPGFTKAAAEQIWQAVQISRGGAFVLFTSYGMLKACHEMLAKKLSDARFNIFKQGDDNRQSLLTRFKGTERSVLFGTDSFWEGVDVVGEALRCVIIVKLPFKVPTEPIVQARTEAIELRGGEPFFEYTLPNAIVKFKQGFGRLIRNKRDRGCIICLDTRLITKGYGMQFLNSLPQCQQVFAPSEHVEQHMRDFYRKTHHLAVGQGK